MEHILSLDQQLFLFINHLPHNGLMNGFVLTLSGIGRAGLVWFGLAVWLFIREEKKDHRFFLPFVSTGVISGALVNLILKPLIGRLRPTIEMGALIIGNGTNDFSFPSGHATIAWAMAVVLARVEPKWRRWFYGLAIAISFSRIYLGVHYPADVLSGAVIGWCIGRTAVQLFPKQRQKAGRK